eukprot:UN23154
MQLTMDAIVEASHLPLSIVIVGVGNADFSAMERLDGDGQIIRNSKGQAAKGDIVQFVPMNQFKNQPIGALAEETLREIPGQLVSYMQRNKISPQPK